MKRMLNYETLKFSYVTTLLLMVGQGLDTLPFLRAHLFDKSNQRRDEYECGYRPFDCHMRQSFSVQFYLVGIVFVLFDVEIAILFPWAYNFWNLSKNSFFLGTFIILFVVIGIFYEGITKAIVWENFSASKIKKNDWFSEIIKALLEIDLRRCLESLSVANQMKSALDTFIVDPLTLIVEEAEQNAQKKQRNLSVFFDNPIDYRFFENIIFFLYADMYSFCSQESSDIAGTKPSLPFDALHSAAITFATDIGFNKIFLDYPLYWNSWKPAIIEFATHFAFRAMSHSYFNFTLETDVSEIGFENCYLDYLLYLSQSLYTLGGSCLQEKTVSTLGVIDASLFLQQQKNNSISFWLEKTYEFFCIFYKYILQELNNSFSCEPFDDKTLIDLKKDFDKKLNIFIVTKVLLFYIIFTYYFRKALGSKKTND